MNLEKNIRCIEITRHGEPSVLQLTTRSMPLLGEGDVLIKVKAAGVNYPDLLQRQGRYKLPPNASDLLGLEVAGEIVNIGTNVFKYSMGDRVCALTSGGGYSEYCKVRADHCIPMPKGLSFVEAASLPETYFTVWFNVSLLGKLSRGQSILVHGGAGGIGTTAIQIAKNKGLSVFTTVSSAAKRDFCHKLGADTAINYLEEDFASVVQEQTNGAGVDMVLDMVGGDYLAKNIECLAKGGRHISLYFMRGSKIEFDFMPILIKNLTLTGSALRPQPSSVKAQIARELATEVWPLLESKKIKPIIHETFALHKASKAHEMMETGGHIGKIVLTVHN